MTLDHRSTLLAKNHFISSGGNSTGCCPPDLPMNSPDKTDVQPWLLVFHVLLFSLTVRFYPDTDNRKHTTRSSDRNRNKEWAGSENVQRPCRPQCTTLPTDDARLSDCWELIVCASWQKDIPSRRGCLPGGGRARWSPLPCSRWTPSAGCPTPPSLSAPAQGGTSAGRWVRNKDMQKSILWCRLWPTVALCKELISRRFIPVQLWGF